MIFMLASHCTALRHTNRTTKAVINKASVHMFAQLLIIIINDNVFCSLLQL